MKALFFFLFITCFATAQNFDDTILEELKIKHDNFTLTLSEINEVIRKCPDISKYPKLLFFKATIYENKENFPLAIKTLLECMRYAKKYQLKYTLLNNLGLDYGLINENKLSRKAFEEVLVLAKNENNNRDIHYAHENLLILDIETSVPNALKTYESYFLNRKYGDEHCLELETLITIVQYYVNANKYDKAETLLEKTTVDLTQISNDTCAYPIKLYYEVKADIAINNKNYNKAVAYLNETPLDKIGNDYERIETYKRYKIAYKFLGNTTKALQYNDTIVALLTANLREFNVTNSLDGIKALENETQKSRKISILNIWLIVAGVTVLGIVLLLLYSKIARHKLQATVSFTQNEYNNLWANYQLSNTQLGKLKEELLKQANSGTSNELNTLLKEVSVHLKTNNDDEHKHINMLKDNFINALKEKAPYLSNQEHLICFFINLNLPHKKIAELLNKTEKSIDSYKYRVNAKVKQQENITLNQLFNTF